MHKFEDVLRNLCTTTTTNVFAYLKRRGFTINKKNRYAYKPGSTPTAPLIVCHADTVSDGGESGHAYSYDGTVARSIALDDRLGITAMLYMLDGPMADCAALVCDDEEIGQSTAGYFETDSQPNWMVELDRRGTDAVCYKYETDTLVGLLEYAGFKIGRGSFSDICYLDNLGIAGFNVGVGYHQEHTDKCHANLVDTFEQLNKLKTFYDKFGDVRLPWNDTRSYSTSWSYKNTWSYNDYLDDRYNDIMDDNSDEDKAIQEWLFSNDPDSYDLLCGHPGFAEGAREVWVNAGRPSLTRYY